MGAIGYGKLQPVGIASEVLVDFVEEGKRVYHHAVSDDVHHAGLIDAGRKTSQGVADTIDFDTVPGIVAALISTDHVGLRGDVVRDLSFPSSPN